MYSNEQVAQLSGIKAIVDAADRTEFLRSIKERRSFTAKSGGFTATMPGTLYMLLPFSTRMRMARANTPRKAPLLRA